MANIIPSIPNTLTNGTTADATQVQADFLAVQTAVNQNAAENGANVSITSLGGLTTAISTVQGGNGNKVGPLTAGCMGYTLSYIGGATYGIAQGLIGADSFDYPILLSTAGFTKTTSAWAAGSGNGSLDYGTLSSSTWYFVYAILNPGSYTTDILLSSSPSAPVMPSGYTKKNRIGAMYITSGGVLLNFTQLGNEFIYTQTGFQDVGGQQMSSAATLKTLTVPVGIKTNALIRAQLYNSNTGSTFAALFYSPDESTQTPTISPGGGNMNASLVADAGQGGNNGIASVELSIRTNTSGQIYVVSSQGAQPNCLYGIWTKGFVMLRGL